LKKNQKFWIREHHKNAEKAKKEEEDAAKRYKNLEDAKKLTISEDPTLKAAVLIKIKNATKYRNTRVKIYGWVHRLRRQG
jgi:asparaginyl-tRNA synthetase